MKLKALLICLSFSILAAYVASAQEAEEDLGNDPPQILTSDLFRAQVVKAPELMVHFVFADSDTIREITIDGERQEFPPGNTVLITKTFRFNPGLTRIEVSAVDEKGNRRTKSYLVGYRERIAEVPEEKEAELKIGVVLVAWYEIDDNPTTDISVAVPIGGLTPDGVVPDSEQPDTRTTLQATLNLTYADAFGVAGVVDTDYAKAENDELEIQAVFLVLGYQLGASKTSAFPLSYTFTDLNIGGRDYALLHTVTLAYASRNPDKEGGTTVHLFGLDLTMKDFASGDREDGSQGRLKWDYSTLDAEKLDFFRSRITAGNNTEGDDSTDYQFVGFDLDWRNQWAIGFRLDAGFGVQYRDYINNEDPIARDTDFGGTRLDILTRATLGLGWQFTPQWSVMLNGDSFVNISNDRPYDRNIYGLVIVGAF